MYDSISIDLSRPHITRGEITSILGMKPIRLEVYRRAFVHKSVNQHVKNSDSATIMEYMLEPNERLELLGDSVLGLIVTDILYTKYTKKDEGFLTRMKTKIVRREGCALFARKLGLGKYIFTSNKININRDSDKILEDTFEAFVGAIYKDLGYEFVWNFINRLVDDYINFDSLLIDTNYKDILLRCTQNKGYSLPKYMECSKSGPAHECKFEVSVEIEIISDDNNNKKKKILEKGKGKNKKSAEQSAAYNLLLELDSMFKYKLLQQFMFRDTE